MGSYLYHALGVLIYTPMEISILVLNTNRGTKKWETQQSWLYTFRPNSHPDVKVDDLFAKEL